MRQSRDIMGMPVYVEITDAHASVSDHERVFHYFHAIDEQFSPYKEQSEVSRLNHGEILTENVSEKMKEVLAKSEETKKLTDGYFDIRKPDGTFDPSGLVKGWAILGAANLIRSFGYYDFYVEAGGDIQTSGKDADGQEWSIGIRNPFNADEIVKVVYPKGKGIATSGTYIRGAHIYDPYTGRAVDDLVSLTVIGPDVYEADRFATAAFAMGLEKGMQFIEHHHALEGYAIRPDKTAVMTSGFERYTSV